jgi:uncharacterized protein YifE (UPF0438 family)
MPDSTMPSAQVEATVAAAARALDALDTADDEAAGKPKDAGSASAAKEGSDLTAEELAAAEAAAQDSESRIPEPKTDEEKAAEAKAAEDAATAAAQKAAERYALKIDGEERQLTLEELKELASKGGDYTRKTQQIAEARKTAEAELQQHRAARQQYGEGLAKVQQALDAMLPPEPDWTKVRAERPDTYTQEFADYQILKQNRDALVAERNRVAQEEANDRLVQRAEFVRAEAERFAAAVPEFRDPVKGPELKAKIYAAAERYGFTREQVDDTTSASLLLMLNDARKYHEVVAAGKTLKEKQQAAAAVARATPAAQPLPTAAPGGGHVAPTPKMKEAEGALSRLRQTHTIADAAAALDALDL